MTEDVTMAPATRILLVEDEPVLGENIACYLKREFAEVYVARDPAAAMEVLRWFAPEVTVVDYGLPGMNGAELYAAMKRASAHPMECIMITAYPPEHAAPAAERNGIDPERVLAKPFSLEALGRLIRTTPCA